MRCAGIAASVLGLGLAVIATAGAGVGPVPGQGQGSAHGLRYVLGTWDAYQQGDIVVTTPCGASAAAVGGGADATGPPKRSRISASRGDDDGSDPDELFDDGWFAEGQNLSSAVRRFDVYAICRIAGGAELDYEAFTVNLAGGEAGTVAVGCAAGNSVIGGGFALTEGNVVQSLPTDGGDGDDRPDDAWKVKARNTTTKTSNFAAAATCLDVGPGDVAYRTASVRAKPNSAKLVTTRCPPSKSVSGGGFSIAGPSASSFVHSIRPRDSRADGNKVPDDRWQAHLVNGTGQRQAVRATAICLG